MAEIVRVSLLVLLIASNASGRSSQRYRERRKNILSLEDAQSLGGNLEYLPGERNVNDILMKAKLEEIHRGFRSPSEFPPARNFLDAKRDIENSTVFRIIQKMPKGAVLHAHSTAIVSSEFIFNNITYRENLYVCENSYKLRLHFFDKPNNDCDWRLLSEIREHPDGAKVIDEKIRRGLSMFDPSANATEHEYENAAWEKFKAIFELLYKVLSYKPVHEDYFYQALQELYDDNVMYLELRAGLGVVYELDGTEYSPLQVARMFRNTAERFVRDHPRFVGVKLIYAAAKTNDAVTFGGYMKNVVELREQLPDFVVGFDLVGQEDTSPILLEWIDKLQKIQKKVPFFFHAGETKWNGLDVDENLIDAVLLNATRIGHGYALLKHPKVMKMIRRRKIAIEICPISNQVLNLVRDLRNHPASVFFANDFPVVVSNDDPGLWGATGLSYDFYEAFMGIMSVHSDLRALKQLALNSIKYSSLNEIEKEKAMAIWTQQWSAFINSYRGTKESTIVPK